MSSDWTRKRNATETHNITRLLDKQQHVWVVDILLELSFIFFGILFMWKLSSSSRWLNTYIVFQINSLKSSRMLYPKFWFCFKQSSIACCYAGGRKTRTWSYLGILIAFRDWGMMFTFESDVFRFIDGETGRRESEVLLSFHMSDSILVLISSAHAHVTIISLYFLPSPLYLDRRQRRVLRGFAWQPDWSDDVKSFTFNKNMLLRSCLFSVSRMLFDTLKFQHTVFSGAVNAGFRQQQPKWKMLRFHQRILVAIKENDGNITQLNFLWIKHK